MTTTTTTTTDTAAKADPPTGVLLYLAAEETTTGAEAREALLAGSITIIEAGLEQPSFGAAYRWRLDV